MAASLQAAPSAQPAAATTPQPRTPPSPQLPHFKVLQSRGAPAQRSLFLGPPGVR